MIELCFDCTDAIRIAHYRIYTESQFSSVKRPMNLCFKHLAEKPIEKINDAEIIHPLAASIHSVILLHMSNKGEPH